MDAALSLIKPNGLIFISFIHQFSGFVWAMKCMQEAVLLEEDEAYVDAVLRDESFTGLGFTEAYFAKPSEALRFMSKFPIAKLHLFGQEGILSPCEPAILKAEQAVINRWLDLSEQLCEREELLSYAEHFMYIGRKL